MAEASTVDGDVDAEEDNDPRLAFDTIVNNMCYKWMELGYRLGLTDPEINTIALKCREDPRPCCYKMLWKWQVKNGSGATWEQLEMIVSEIGHKDVSEKLRKKRGDFNKKPNMYYQLSAGIDASQTRSKSIVAKSETYASMLYHDDYARELVESNDQYEQQVVKSKDPKSDPEYRALLHDMDYEVKRAEKLEVRRRYLALKEENDRLERELEMKAKNIERRSLQNNDTDSAIGSGATRSHRSLTSSTNDGSRPGAETKVPMIEYYNVVDKQCEDSNNQ
ncbi:PREDICTED: uncharacterized protein LOC109483967 isoform X2 [Branchiostoma belcheri]|uniref:Uncharacterized protein LOC109483967 isoform X2 n=1 Tax=Branchiostoma belcheri TaxID=7741 RepID=A0A6P5A903_BRABE|nr:PREDICTED: uncharacterized protein LOC109483967 isoform X2 [Branchiostoma belcheri]